MGRFSNDKQGNLVYVTDALSDAASIIVFDRQSVNPGDANVEFIWSFKQGMKVARPSEVVLYHSN
jgi:hypothetical protein